MRTFLVAAIVALLASGPVAALALPGSAPSNPTALPASPGHHHYTVPFLNDPEHLFTQPEDPVFARALAPSTADGYAADAAAEYTIDFVCPPNVQSDIADVRCPAYILDAEDIMGQPVLLVDQKNPRLVAFNALHGGLGVRLPTAAPVPSEGSRDDLVHQPHTTFQTEDAGNMWDDNRYYSPLHLSKAEIFGVDNAAVLDHQGKMLISSLYAYREEASSPLQYTMFNWQSEKISETFTDTTGFVRRDSREVGAVITEIHMAFDANTRQAAVFWLEQGADGLSYVQGDHVPVGEGVWEPIDPYVRLGPCSDITNVIESSDNLYIGCVAAEGYPLPDGAAHGDLMIHRFDPTTWNHTVVGVAPVPSGSAAALASAESWTKRGIAVAGAALVDGVPSVKTAVGVDGKDWTATADYGAQLTDRSNRSGATPLEVRINALAYVRSSGTLHFVYMERFAASNDPSVAAPSGTSPYYKVYGVAHGSGQFMGRFGFAYGDPQARAAFAARTQGNGDGAFADRHDSIVVLPGKGADRVFLAVGDHGFVRYAEVREATPVVPIAPLAAAPPAIPAPIAALNPALAGAVAGTLSLSIVARMAASRNKKTAEAPT